MTQKFLVPAALACSVLFAVATLGAQTLGSGTIAGVVKDTTGAVLPGVTVEATSPNLIEKVRTVVTDDSGQYKIVDLRPGAYTVTFTLPGFNTTKRDGIELTTAFTATINAEMRVGSVEETVTVSGLSSLVDTQNVMQQKTIARETLDALPTGRSTGSYASLIPGAVGSATSQDVGGTQSEQGTVFGIHGSRSSDINLYQDGMQLNSLLAAGNTTFSFNRASTQEVIVETGGISAESSNGGVQINVVPKEGGNALDAYFSTSYTNNHLQGDNLTDSLRSRGLSAATKIRRIYELSASLGGPIKRDRLWFFTAHRWWGSSQSQLNNYFNATQNTYLYTADTSRPAYTDDYYRDNAIRLTWQAAQKHKINVSYQLQGNCNCFNGLLTANAAPEAIGAHHYSPNYALQASWSHPATNKLLLEAGATAAILTINSERQAGVSPNDISVLESSSNYRYRSRALNLGPAGSYGKHITNQINQRASASYITGSHAFKAGLFLQEAWKNHSITEINGGMDYTFRNGSPTQVRLWALPYTEEAELFNVGLFGQDQWTIKHVTLNLGLRFDYLDGSVPEQHLGAGALVPARDFAAVKHIPNWKDVSPRLGAAYDLFGNGKTAIKGFLGRYVGLESLNGFVSLNNPVNTSVNSATRQWSDNNRNFVPDCNLTLPALNEECGPLSDPLFGQQKINTVYAEDVLHGFGNRSYNWQGSVSFQHELRPGLAVNAAYFRTWFGNFNVTDNVLVTPADYDEYCVTAPSDPRLPGGGGERVCGLYDIKPASFSSVSNVVTQAEHYGKQREVFNGFDLTVNGRFPAGALVSGGLSVGRTVTDNCFVVDSPQQQRDGFCRVSPPWSAGTQVKIAAVYPLPWDLQTSATYQNLPGIPVLASYLASNAQIFPSLGRNLGACGASTTCTATTTFDLIEPNTEFEDRIQQVDFRITKILRIGRTKLQGSFDIYNLLNASPILAEGTRYTAPGATVVGAAWLQPTQILAARLFKFGMQLDF